MISKFESYEEEEPDIYDELNKFEKNRRSEDCHQKWENNFYGKSADFSSEENIEKLKQMPPNERLFMLAKTGNFLTFTSNMAGKYFEEFPGDLEIIKLMFLNCNGLPDNGSEYHLFTLSAPYLNLSESERRCIYNYDSYLEKAERRNYAPNVLLENHEGYFKDKFNEFGKGAKGFSEALYEANKMIMGGGLFY